MAPRTAQRDYAGVIAESPVRHALFNKPFTSLRRRTENLLDTITGGTVAEDVQLNERRDKERQRALTCRMCRMVYANDAGLKKHYDLFPKHLTAQLPPKSKTKMPPSPSPSAIISPVAVVAIPDVSAPSAAAPEPRTHMLHTRARSSPNVYHLPTVVPSSRPYPTVPPMPLLPRTAPSPPSPPAHVPAHSPPIAAYGSPTSPARAHAHSPPKVAYASPNSPARSASDFYASPPTNAVGGYADYKMLYNDPSSASSPYALPNAMAAANAQQQHPAAVEAAPPRAAAMLPNFDFESRFQTVTLNGVLPPSSPQRRPLPKQPTGAVDQAMYERNRQAGANSAAKLPPIYTGSAANGAGAPQPEQDVRRQRAVRRGASESQIAPTTSAGTRAAMPSTFGGVVRAVVATGATGSRGQPVMPSQASPVRQNRPVNSWLPLGDDEEAEQQQQHQSMRTRTRTSSTSGKQWGSLFDPLPGSPTQDFKTIKPNSPTKEPIGSTSFSNSPSAAASPTAEDVDEGGDVPARPRRNTNPFLNRDFMRSIPTVLKTPPLTPSSPWGNGSGGPSSPGNPFQQLIDADDDVDDDGDSRASPTACFDTGGGPKTPAIETRGKTLSNNSLVLPSPVARAERYNMF